MRAVLPPLLREGPASPFKVAAHLKKEGPGEENDQYRGLIFSDLQCENFNLQKLPIWFQTVRAPHVHEPFPPLAPRESRCFAKMKVAIQYGRRRRFSQEISQSKLQA